MDQQTLIRLNKLREEQKQLEVALRKIVKEIDDITFSCEHLLPDKSPARGRDNLCKFCGHAINWEFMQRMRSRKNET